MLVRASLLALCLVGCEQPKPVAEKMPASGTLMAGDSMTMKAEAMLPAVRAHLDSLGSATPAMHDAAMVAHDSVMRGVLRAMRGDLMHMGMHSDSAYEALADSVVKDQAELSAAPAARQPELLRLHLDRVRRLLSVYDVMVAKGKRG
jgi:hypothetical protein